nr:MAG TPA: hypothetical protein [Bacteriophage sp.]
MVLFIRVPPLLILYMTGTENTAKNSRKSSISIAGHSTVDNTSPYPLLTAKKILYDTISFSHHIWQPFRLRHRTFWLLVHGCEWEKCRIFLYPPFCPFGRNGRFDSALTCLTASPYFPPQFLLQS